MALPYRQTVWGLALLAFCSAAPAMNLLQAYQAALEQDANVRAGRATLASGMERLPQARSQLLPAVSANVGRNQNQLATTSTTLSGNSSVNRDSYYSFNNSLSLRQPLFNLPRYFQVKQAEHLVQESVANYEREVQNLVVRVGGAYMEALLAAENLKLVQAQKRQYTAMVDAARKALVAGTGTRTDIDDAQSRLDMAQANELEARQNEDYTRKQLELMINQPLPALSGLGAQGIAALSQKVSALPHWVDLAHTNSPEIRALSARLDAATKEISKAQSGHAPTLDAVAQWSDSGNENVTRLNSRFENKAIGFQLSMPLYQGGAVNSQVRQAVAEKTRVEESLESLRRDLNLRVHKEYRGVTEGLLRILALEQALRSSTQLLDSTQKSQRAGVRTMLDVLNAEQQLVAVNRDLIQARYVYLMSRLRLSSLAGVDALTAVTEINQAFVP
ncbi:TolC family outer membrane protein [Limnohabitans sp.]|uniref:TolC family outer membrane protein n=1 Tax=Limnohabitans sp. TaxID=1907725 RepID=UPI0039BD1EC4|nr:TolC family outer membrane protein [Comamonadaceae bacterium]